MELLLVSHRGVATGMKAAISMVMGPAADQITALELTEDEGIENFGKRLEEHLVSWLTEGKKGLIFADLRGGTPYNQSEMILDRHGLKSRAKVISGMNLPMIIDALFKDIDVNDLAAVAEVAAAAKDGVACLDLEAQSGSSDDE
ncbi:MAG TPA: hypothetical protein IAC37_05110 [Candidatus Ventrimonas merdavium]|nr:hypothetical protein [Candidatus Ventrimonas merdavium]